MIDAAAAARMPPLPAAAGLRLSGATCLLPVPLDPAAALPVPVGDQRIDTPAMLIDLDIAEANIAKMADYASRVGLQLRPHVKTHKSLAMARRQLAAGAAGLCAATVTEAAVLAAAGIADITLAYPVVGERKLTRLAAVCVAADVTLVADSAEVADGYDRIARQIGRTIRVLIEVDTGMRRVGVAPSAVPNLARHVGRCAALEFRGILTHAGHAHDADGQLGIEQVARDEAAVMGSVRTDLERSRP